MTKDKYNQISNDNNYKWETKENIMGKDVTIEQLYANWKKIYSKFVSLSKDFYKSKAKLKLWIETLIEKDKIQARIEAFLETKEIDVPKATKWKSLRNKYSKDKGLFEKKQGNYFGIIVRHQKKIKQYLKSKELNEYKRYFEYYFLNDLKHAVSKEDIRTSDIVQSDAELDRLWQCIRWDIVDKRPIAYDEKGKKIVAKYYSELWDNTKSQEIRKTSWVNFWYEFFIRKFSLLSLAELFNLRTNQEAHMQNFNNYFEQYLYRIYEMKQDDCRKLLDNARVFRDLHIRFKDHTYGVINNIYKLKQVGPWDERLENKFFSHDITINQAKEAMLETFKFFGEDCYKLVKYIFKHKCIQWTAKEGEKYNFTLSYDGHLKTDIIKIDFDGSVDCLATLAHEIGHWIAGYYAKKQKIYKSMNNLTVEIPSIVAEVVFLLKVIDKSKNKKHAYEASFRLLRHFFYAVNEYAYKTIFKFYINKFFFNDGKLNLRYMVQFNEHLRNKIDGLTKIEKQWYTQKTQKSLVRYVFFDEYFHTFKENEKIRYFVGQIIGVAIGYSIYLKSEDNLQRFLKFIRQGFNCKPIQVLKTLGIDINNIRIYKYTKGIILDVLKFYENLITLNKPGSLRFGKYQKFTKDYKKIK